MNGDTVRGPSQPIAALTYLLGFVTGIIFLYLEPYNQDEFVRFHARQSIGFSVLWFAVNVIFGVFVAVLPRAPRRPFRLPGRGSSTLASRFSGCS